MRKRPDARGWLESYAIEMQAKARREHRSADEEMLAAAEVHHEGAEFRRSSARYYQVWASYYAELARMALLGLVRERGHVEGCQ